MRLTPNQTAQLREALAWLEKKGSKKTRDEQLTRYGIVAPKAYGVSMANIQSLAKKLGRDHDLAAALWETGWYEARLLCAYVDEPERVTPAQMDRWARDFDNWGVCDTVCFKLFDQTPYAMAKVSKWSRSKDEFVKRAAFALLACVALHDKTLPDAALLNALPLIERAATDDRNFVKKAVSWALKALGAHRPKVKKKALALAKKLAQSSDPTARWIGKSI